MVVVQFLPDKAGAQKLAHFFIAIALIAALANALKARRREETIPERIGEKGTCVGLCRERWPWKQYPIGLKYGVRMFFWRRIVIFAYVYNVVSYGSNR